MLQAAFLSNNHSFLSLLSVAPEDTGSLISSKEGHTGHQEQILVVLAGYVEKLRVNRKYLLMARLDFILLD
jgi:hypothetical protein